MELPTKNTSYKSGCNMIQWDFLTFSNTSNPIESHFSLLILWYSPSQRGHCRGHAPKRCAGQARACAFFLRSCRAVVVNDHDPHIFMLQCNATRRFAFQRSHLKLHASHSTLQTPHFTHHLISSELFLSHLSSSHLFSYII